MEEAASVFCDAYCRWPLECGSREELEMRCDSCTIIRLADIGAGRERDVE